MPATKLGRRVRDMKDPPQDRAFRAAMAAGLAEQGMTEAQLAARLGVSEDTLARRRKDPSGLKLSELRAMAGVFDWDAATVGRML